MGFYDVDDHGHSRHTHIMDDSDGYCSSDGISGSGEHFSFVRVPSILAGKTHILGFIDRVRVQGRGLYNGVVGDHCS